MTYSESQANYLKELCAKVPNFNLNGMIEFMMDCKGLKAGARDTTKKWILYHMTREH